LRRPHLVAFSVGFYAGHAAGVVAKTLFLLALAVLVRRAFAQTFLVLDEQFNEKKFLCEKK